VKVLFIFLVLTSAGILQTSSSSSAQVSTPEVRVISGTVLDPSGAAIPGAKVALTGVDGTQADQSVTDNAGGFRL
jgi:hypothetical protein